MKKILSILSLFIILSAFNKDTADQYTINGTIKGIADGKKVILQKVDELKGLISVDSTIVSKEKFSFSGTSKEPSIYVFMVEDIQDKISFIVEKGVITAQLYKDSLSSSVISGTENNKSMQQFLKGSKKIQKKLMNFQNDNLVTMQAAQQQNDTLVMSKLMSEFNAIQAENLTYSKTFIQNNPKAFISLLLLDSYFKSQQIPFEDVKSLNTKLDKSLKSLTLGKSLEERITNYISVEVGMMAPNFSAPNPEGKIVSLKESLGKVTIIDFWASWCGPCRKENPNVVAMYNELHPKGLNIIGVSLDKEDALDKWKDAIEKDQLTWTHISNLKFWSDPIVQMYKINSIPATFILDGKGKIVAVNLRGEELKAKVKELLNQK